MTDSTSSLIDVTLAGRFRILELLGEGAMGEVYLAEQVAIDRKVVVKVLKRHLESDHVLVERFRREARAASHLDHPNIVYVVDFGQTDDGHFFLVMEHIPGQSLEHEMQSCAPELMPLPRVISILGQVSNALVTAHEQGIIHRDLKPANILLGESRTGGDLIKILDFGLAKIVQDELLEKLTREGEIFGTPAYMSPEQARGDTVDTRTDLYAFGVMAFEMVTGRLPYIFRNMQELYHAHMNLEPPEVFATRPQAEVSLPPDLADLIMACIQKDRFLRAQDALEIRSTLEALQERNKKHNKAFGVRSTVPILNEIIDQMHQIEPTVQAPAPQRPPEGEAKAHSLAVPQDVSLEWLWNHLCKKARALAEKLRANQLGSVEFTRILASLANLDEQVMAYETDLALARSSLEDLEAASREREARLRYAVVDLSIERSRLVEVGVVEQPMVQDLDFQISELERRLANVAHQLEQSHESHDNEIQRRELEHVEVYRQQSSLEQRLQQILFEHRPPAATPDIQNAYEDLSGLSQMLTRRTSA